MITVFVYQITPGLVVGYLKHPDVLPIGEENVGPCDAGVEAGQKNQPSHQPP